MLYCVSFYLFKMQKVSLTIALSWILTLTSTPKGVVGHTQVNISLFATDLNGCGALTHCDPYVKIMCSTISSDWRLCGQTEALKSDDYPVWPERFSFQHIPSDNMRWRFDVMDKNVFFDSPIGSASVIVENFLKATEIQATMKFDLNGRGAFYVHRRS